MPRGGSRKPITLVQPGQNRMKTEAELIPVLDGREMSAIDILLEVQGDVEIAAERANMTESDFGRYLARCDPEDLAEGLKALQLMQVFNMASRISRTIMDNVDELKPGQLVALYPKLVELIPVLSASHLAVHAHQTNNTTLNFNRASGTREDAIPEDVLAAMARLGLDPTGAPRVPISALVTSDRDEDDRAMWQASRTPVARSAGAGQDS